MPYQHIIDTIFWKIVASFTDAEIEMFQRRGELLKKNDE